MSDLRTIVFAGGGTGGHLFPGIAIASELRKRDPGTRIVFVGTARAIESTIAHEHQLEHRVLSVEPLSLLKRNPFRFIHRNWKAWRSSHRILNELNPQVVIGLGGYSSAPIVWAANRRQIPIVLLEPNAIPGRATRWLCRSASSICAAFPEVATCLKHSARVIVTGNPVRKEIAALFHRTSTNDSSRELLILGGSQGANSLNEVVLAAIRKNVTALNGWKIVHQAGPQHADQIRQTYAELQLDFVVEPFFHDLPVRYATAGLVVSRAGATTLAELACAGIASILMPYPHSADNHQRANAMAYVNSQAAVLIEHQQDAVETATALSQALQRLINDRDCRMTMGSAARTLAHPDAAERIAEVIEQLM